ncbi:MAG: carbohydrate ABC transporter permease, partial [Rhodospirillales bacterium]|nr:carbohydrate ABC transporter permease [Rhodospirillales bacterium]
MSRPGPRRRMRTLLLTAGGVLVSIYVLAPFSWLVLTSFMHEKDVLSVPLKLSWNSFTFNNYLSFVHASGVTAVVGSRAAENTLPAIVNSLIAATATAALNLLLGTLAGYSFARMRFPGRMPLLMLYLGSRMVPGIALIVPLYLTIRSLHLLDSLLALTLTYLTLTLPFTIWLMKNYFQGIARSLEEAAMVDGCNWWQMLWRVLVPVAAPGLAAAAIFAFMTAWNDYLFAVILTTTMAAETAPVVVAGFVTDVTTARTLMATGGVLAVLPPLVLALLSQRLIVQGLTSGAV